MLEGFPLSGPLQVVAARDSEHPYTKEKGTAKLARDRKQPYLTRPKSWCFIHMIRYDIIGHVTMLLLVCTRPMIV